MQEDKNVKKSGMRSELKKVIWPTAKQTTRSTFVTIAFVLIISVALIVLNLVFSELNKLWIKSLPGNNTFVDRGVSGETNNTVTPTLSGETQGTTTSGENVSGD